MMNDTPPDVLMQYHLQHNIMPPIHSIFIPFALQAVDLYNNEDYDILIELPNNKILTAGQIVEELRLEAWINQDEEF